MNQLQNLINEYFDYCKSQKRLDEKTLKAYSTDLSQFSSTVKAEDVEQITSDTLEEYLANLHQLYKPKTVKRKVASIKSFFHYLEYKDLIDRNPFNKIQIRFREPAKLPKTIPLHTVEQLLKIVYFQRTNAHTSYQKRNALRDAAVIELLFATGMRISELCSLNPSAVDLIDRSIRIYGKGDKERCIQIGNDYVVQILKEYKDNFDSEISKCNYFFANQAGKQLSDQAVRRMINKYVRLASIELHITPHMFRHTFATSLLDADVDIRYIQEMLGHSSIHITEIYTHVAMSKQKDILATKHPRKDFNIG